MWMYGVRIDLLDPLFLSFLCSCFLLLSIVRSTLMNESNNPRMPVAIPGFLPIFIPSKFELRLGTLYTMICLLVSALVLQRFINFINRMVEVQTQVVNAA